MLQKNANFRFGTLTLLTTGTNLIVNFRHQRPLQSNLLYHKTSLFQLAIIATAVYLGRYDLSGTIYGIE